jgi:hypothetical protein
LLYVIGTVGFVGLGMEDVEFPCHAPHLCGQRVWLSAFCIFVSGVDHISHACKIALGRAVGWFWFVFTGGLNVFGAYYSSWAIDRIGYQNTLMELDFLGVCRSIFCIGFE